MCLLRNLFNLLIGNPGEDVVDGAHDKIGAEHEDAVYEQVLPQIYHEDEVLHVAEQV